MTRSDRGAAPSPATCSATLRLVPMRWWHLGQVMGLEGELFGAESWSEEAFWAELAQPETRHYLVALAGAEPASRVVGYAGLGVFGDEAHVLTLGVTTGWQRRGVGGRLLRALLAEAERQASVRVLLDVRADNPAAQRLYAGHGFVPVGRRKGYYQPSGVDAVVMVRG